MRRLFIFFVLFGICGISRAQYSKEINNIKAFAKLYGLVKYHYPGDEAALIDWDYFAILGVEKVRDLKTDEELIRTLKDLFCAFAPDVELAYKTQEDYYPASFVYPESKVHKVFYLQASHGFYSVNNGIKKESYSQRPYRHAISYPGGDPFSHCIIPLPLKKYRGLNCKVSVKLVNTTPRQGAIECFIQAGDSLMKWASFSDSCVRVKAEWLNYMANGKIPFKTNSVQLHFVLRGYVEVCIDDIRVEIETKKGWELVYCCDFESYKDVPSYWRKKNENKNNAFQSKMQIHSNDNHFLSIRTIKAPVQIKKAYTKPMDDFDGVMMGDCSWVNIHGNIKAYVPNMLWADKNTTYPIADTHRLAKLNREIELIEDVSGNNLNVRIANVIISWCAFQQNFMGPKQPVANWDFLLTDCIGYCYGDQNEQEFIKVLKRMIGGLHCDGFQVFHQRRHEDFCWMFSKNYNSSISSGSFFMLPGGYVVTYNSLKSDL